MLALLLLAGGARDSRAQSAGDEANSRARFEQAAKLENQGDWARACPLYQEAHDLNATGGTALRAANCYEQLGEDEKALALYRFIVERRASDAKPERITIAESRIRVLEYKLRHKRAAPPGATTPRPVSRAAPVAPPPAPAAKAEGPNRTAVGVAFSVGAAGLAVGSIFGVLALSEASDVKTACETSCGAAEREAADDATALGWASNIGFGVAIAGAATGVVLLAIGGASSAGSAGRGSGHLRLGSHGVAVRF